MQCGSLLTVSSSWSGVYMSIPDSQPPLPPHASLLETVSSFSRSVSTLQHTLSVCVFFFFFFKIPHTSDIIRYL